MSPEYKRGGKGHHFLKEKTLDVHSSVSGKIQKRRKVLSFH